MESKGPELSVYIMEVSITVIEVQITWHNSGFSGTGEAVLIVEVSVVRVIKGYFIVTSILAGMSQEPNIFCQCHVIH